MDFQEVHKGRPSPDVVQAGNSRLEQAAWTSKKFGSKLD
jgi:hypothetical protein